MIIQTGMKIVLTPLIDQTREMRGVIITSIDTPGDIEGKPGGALLLVQDITERRSGQR